MMFGLKKDVCEGTREQRWVGSIEMKVSQY